MKYRLRTSIYMLSGGLLMAVLPLLAYAQDSYQTLVNLPGVPNVIDASSSLADYIGGLFDIVIGLAIVLSIIMLVVGGIEYIGSGANESVRSDAKDRITNAVIGLLIALASILLLNLVNPNLTSVNIGIGDAEGGSIPLSEYTNIQSAQGGEPGGGNSNAPRWCFTYEVVGGGVREECFPISDYGTESDAADACSEEREEFEGDAGINVLGFCFREGS